MFGLDQNDDVLKQASADFPSLYVVRGDVTALPFDHNTFEKKIESRQKGDANRVFNKR